MTPCYSMAKGIKLAMTGDQSPSSTLRRNPQISFSLSVVVALDLRRPIQVRKV